MAQVSRNPLSKKVENQMFVIFRNVLVELHTERDVESLLDDLLTPTEKIMLCKRLAIAFLLEKGYDQRTIHKLIHVSTTTVNSVNFSLQQNGIGYRKVIKIIREKEKRKSQIERLDAALEELFSKKAILRRAYGFPSKM